MPDAHLWLTHLCVKELTNMCKHPPPHTYQQNETKAHYISPQCLLSHLPWAVLFASL